MPVYVTLWKYTREGMMDITNTTKRFQSVQKIIEKSGGKLRDIYGLVGDHDVITIMELPDSKTLASTIIKICHSGRITAETMSALPIDEFLEVTKDV